MFLATVIVSLLLAAAALFAAARKLTHRKEVVESYLRAGVPEDRLNLLAAVLIAGAAGLVAGLFWAPLGVAAAGAFTVYFAAAVAFHARAGDLENAATPLALSLAAAAAAALRVLSASASSSSF
jgi:hypothetical protein